MYPMMMDMVVLLNARSLFGQDLSKYTPENHGRLKFVTRIH